MQTIGIKELQVNPAKLTNALETKQYTMITKRSNPIGVAIAFDDNILSNGLKTALLIDGFKQGNLSLGQLSNSLNISKKETLKLLSLIGVDILDYDFDDDLNAIDTFL